jgi:hypothetical protein
MRVHFGVDVDWTKLASDSSVDKTATALRARGITVFVVNNREDARKMVLTLMPKGSQVMRANSITLDQTGLIDDIQGNDYVSLREKLTIDTGISYLRDDDLRRAITPQYELGSVHAVTEDGQVAIASSTGSQLAPYVFGAEKVIWIVGTQKIVKTLDEAMERIYEFTLPLVSDSVQKASGVKGTSVNKILIVEKEPVPRRTTLIFVKEKLGF